MDNFYPFGFFIILITFVLFSFTKGEKTSHRDDDIDDYWSGD